MTQIDKLILNEKLFPSVATIAKRRDLFTPGDTVKVYIKIVEGGNERIQIFEGIVIRKRGGGINTTFTVRKISYGIGVERTFPLCSPMIDKIEVVKKGRPRRSRLYYLRTKKGKSAQVKEQN